MKVRKYSEKSEMSEHHVYVALKIIKENDGKMLLSDLMVELNEREGKKSALPSDSNDPNKDGSIKWHIRMKFAADGFVKAGLLRKVKGVWHITSEGERALDEKTESEVIEMAKAARRQLNRPSTKKKKGRQEALPPGDDEPDDDDSQGNKIENYHSEAKGDIKKYVCSLGAYEFQDLCAALIGGMGYHVREISPPGPDGGIDIIAYTDPVGGKLPRIKVQVKHYTENEAEGRKAIKVPDTEVRRLARLLVGGDIGILMTSSGFTRKCVELARENNKHIELIDFERFIELWTDHYDKLSEEDKKLLPLKRVYFLDK